MFELISYILSFIAASGGLGGIVTSWYYWKRFKKKVKIIPLGSWYKIGQEIIYDETRNFTEFISDERPNKILIELNFLVINVSNKR